MGEVIAFANQKGGVGKTTSVVSVASFLAMDGHSVLLIDMDPQGNATSGIGLDQDSIDSTIYDVLLGDNRLDDVARETPLKGLSAVPANRGLAGAEIELVPNATRERQLHRALESSAKDFDFVLLDCPPSLGLLTVNSLTAADSVLIPLQCEYYALEGLSQLISTIDLIRDHLNPTLSLKGVVLTMYDARTSLSADVAAEVRNHLGEQVFDSIVPRSVRLAEAPSYGLPIGLYSAGSRGAQAYRSITAELLRRTGIEPGASLRDATPIEPRNADREQEATEA